MTAKNKPKAKSAAAPDADKTFAAQLSNKDGDQHHVLINALKVHVYQDEDAGCWLAQGLEIDYLALGNSEEEAKSNFEDGLAATINEYLKIYSNIKGLLVPAPKEAWQPYLQSPNAYSYTQFTSHKFEKEEQETKDLLAKLNFSGIAYLHKQQPEPQAIGI